MNIRPLVALFCGTLVLLPVPPVSAAQTVEATSYAVVLPEDDQDNPGGQIARVTLVCGGRADGGASTVIVIAVEITCEVWDSSGLPQQQIRRHRNWSGGNCVCVVNAFNLRLPVRYCSTVTATFADATTSTDRSCTAFGSPAPPEVAPPAGSPGLLECMDPLGTRL